MDLKNERIPLLAILISFAASSFAYGRLPYRIPAGIYVYPAAITLVYLFFRLIPYADKNRTRQLREIGLYDPLRHGAVLLFVYLHLLNLGVALGWFSPRANPLVGILALLVLIAGSYIHSTRPAWLETRIPRLAGGGIRTLGRVLILSGAGGLIGACTGRAQALWLAVPLILGLLYIRSRFSHHSGPPP